MVLTKFRIGAILFLLILICQASSASTFHFNEGRAGNFSDSGPKTAELVYKLSLNPIHGSPVVNGDTVYVIADYSWGRDNSMAGLHAINANNGTKIWHYSGIYSMSTPAIDGGNIYVHVYNEKSGMGELMAFNASSGTLLWNVSLESGVGSWVVSSSPLVYNSSVYVITYHEKLYKFSTDGSEVWNITLGTEAKYIYMSSPSAWNGTIYVAVNDSGSYRLFALKENGVKLWNRTLAGVPKATPVIYGQTVFIPTSERLYGFNTTTGAERWNISFDGTLSTPAVSSGKIYVANKTTLFCFNISSGQELWNFTAISNPGAYDSIASSPAVAGGVVYFATNTANGTIYALNSSTGSMIWKYTTSNYIMSSPYIYNGKLYIGADDGNLYIFGLWKGSVVVTGGTFNVTDVAGKTYTVSNFTVLGVLQKLKEAAGINYSVYLSTYDNKSLFLSSLGGITNGWWMTEVNGQGIGTGMQFVNVSDGDVVTFWLYPSGASGKLSSKNAPYLVEVTVKAKLAEINSFSVKNGTRGGFINATVNITPYYTGWLAVVVSGTNSNGDSIAGVATVKVTHQQTVEIPVMIAVPQQIQAGNYRLYAGIYKLEKFPDEISEYLTTSQVAKVS